jgi:hypothetical protein
MGDLADALRAEGHAELADKLETKELAGRLRQSGRDDLADALEAGAQTTPADEEEAQPNAERTPPAPHEQLAKQLDEAQSRWITLGGSGGSDAA